MTEPVTPMLDVVGAESRPVFEPYTMFAQTEAALEQHLGESGKLKLPERHRQTFTKYMPWVALVLLPVNFAALLLLLGVSALATLVGSSSFVGALLHTAVFALYALALPGLFAKTRRGWALFVYAMALSLLGSLLDLSLLGLLIDVGIVWIAFQVKYNYR